MAQDALDPGPDGSFPWWPRCAEEACPHHGQPWGWAQHYIRRGGQRFLISQSRPPGLRGMVWCETPGHRR